jgi:hypothetical protein
MVPDPSKTSLGLEYFWTEGDELGSMSDADLIELGKQEIERIGLAKYADVEDGVVFRVLKAYPVYDSAYRDSLVIVRKFVDGLQNFQTIGRNGLHRYDNQDHAMITGMLAVRNLMLGEKHALWNINTEGEYHEEVAQPDVAQAFDGKLTRVFSRIDPVAFGVSTGITAGLGLFLITLFSMIKNDPFAISKLQLLNQFFLGYTVTVQGGFVGMFYAFLVGFIGGWALAFLRNVALYVSVLIIHRDIEMTLLEEFLDFM